MSAKITLIFFIIIFFEIGILLVALPWFPIFHWNENYFLVLTADKLHMPWFANALKSGYVKGAVTGIGLVNIMLGVMEIINFKKTAHAFQAMIENEINRGQVKSTPVPDNGSPEPAAHDGQRGDGLSD